MAEKLIIIYRDISKCTPAHQVHPHRVIFRLGGEILEGVIHIVVLERILRVTTKKNPRQNPGYACVVLYIRMIKVVALCLISSFRGAP